MRMLRRSSHYGHSTHWSSCVGFAGFWVTLLHKPWAVVLGRCYACCSLSFPSSLLNCLSHVLGAFALGCRACKFSNFGRDLGFPICSEEGEDILALIIIAFSVIEAQGVSSWDLTFRARNRHRWSLCTHVARRASIVLSSVKFSLIAANRHFHALIIEEIGAWRAELVGLESQCKQWDDDSFGEHLNI